MSFLKIAAENASGRTILSSCEFSSPLKIARPFYETGRTRLMMMAASAGLFDGDEYEIEIRAQENCSLEFCGQSFSKIFSSQGGGGSRQTTKIFAESGARFLYSPPPVIPFAGSVHSAKTEVRLSSGAKFASLEIFSCGRAAKGERFEFESFRSRTKIFAGDELVFLDNARFVPAEFPLDRIGYFESFSHCATIFIFGSEDVPSPIFSDEIELAFSRAKAGICGRALANSADAILKAASPILSSAIWPRPCGAS